jgi:hypothetical protein
MQLWLEWKDREWYVGEHLRKGGSVFFQGFKASLRLDRLKESWKILCQVLRA